MKDRMVDMIDMTSAGDPYLKHHGSIGTQTNRFKNEDNNMDSLIPPLIPLPDGGTKAPELSGEDSETTIPTYWIQDK